MKLPYAAKARVERKKVAEYLLSFCIPTEVAKNLSFQGLGFAWRSGRFLPVLLENMEEKIS
jgi:hypothetical protein